MQETTICVRGARAHIEALRAVIRDSEFDGIEVSGPLPSKGNLLSRTPLGQSGIFELLISVAASMASSAAYDGVKLLIAQFSKDGKVETATITPEPKHKPKSSRESAKHKPEKSGAPKKGLRK
jgi:hypothetical protein